MFDVTQALTKFARSDLLVNLLPQLRQAFLLRHYGHKLTKLPFLPEQDMI